MEQYAIKKFAESLESLPRALAENSGVKVSIYIPHTMTIRPKVSIYFTPYHLTITPKKKRTISLSFSFRQWR